MMDDTNIEERLHSVNSEGFAKMEEEVKEELEDPMPQDLCHIKMEDDSEEETGEEETEKGVVGLSTVVPSEEPTDDPLSYPRDCYFICQYCGFGTPAVNVLDEHISKRRDGNCPISCAKCTFSCSEMTDLVVHLQTWHGEKARSTAVSGHQSFVQTPQDFKEFKHKTFQHEERLPVKIEEQEDDCSGKGPFDENLTEPCLSALLSATPDKLTSTDPTTSLTTRRYVCGVCQARFTKLDHLKAHQRIHTKERPYACDLCQSKFTQPHHLKIHQRTHSNEKPYPCDLCSARFTQLGHLKTHRRIHTLEKPYACELCSAKFTESGGLRKHQRTHTKEKPYSCEICSARFTESGSLKSHKRIHTKEKPYTCDVCSSSFTYNSNLRSHQRIHTNERPYACDICSARFTRLTHVKTHKRIHTTERPYTCDVCSAGFTQLGHLKRHQKSLHE